MASPYEKFFGTLSSLCKLGLLGPLPMPLRSIYMFFGFLLLLIIVPLLMRNAGRWRWILISMPVYWAAVSALLIICSQNSKGELPDAVGWVAMLALIPYLGMGVYAIIGNKEHRILTSVIVVANCYLAFFVTFISAMAATGNWI